jgi:hypothetical protein
MTHATNYSIQVKQIRLMAGVVDNSSAYVTGAIAGADGNQYYGILIRNEFPCKVIAVDYEGFYQYALGRPADLSFGQRVPLRLYPKELRLAHQQYGGRLILGTLSNPVPPTIENVNLQDTVNTGLFQQQFNFGWAADLSELTSEIGLNVCKATAMRQFMFWLPAGDGIAEIVSGFVDFGSVSGPPVRVVLIEFQ